MSGTFMSGLVGISEKHTVVGRRLGRCAILFSLPPSEIKRDFAHFQRSTRARVGKERISRFKLFCHKARSLRSRSPIPNANDHLTRTLHIVSGLSEQILPNAVDKNVSQLAAPPVGGARHQNVAPSPVDQLRKTSEPN